MLAGKLVGSSSRSSGGGGGGAMLQPVAVRSDEMCADEPRETPSTAELAAARADEEVAGEATPAEGAPGGNALLSGARRIAKGCSDVLNRPIVASLSGLFVGCTPLHGLLAARDAPLRVLLDGMEARPPTKRSTTMASALAGPWPARSDRRMIDARSSSSSVRALCRLSSLCLARRCPRGRRAVDPPSPRPP
jgi:hypothetical protein